MPDRGQHVALLALLRVKGVHWHFVAREAQRPDGLERLLAGKASEGSAEATESLELLAAAAACSDARRREIERMLAASEAEGVRLTTVLDDDYPVNLRTIFNLPPFLFYRGELRDDDCAPLQSWAPAYRHRMGCIARARWRRCSVNTT